MAATKAAGKVVDQLETTINAAAITGLNLFTGHKQWSEAESSPDALVLGGEKVFILWVDERNDSDTTDFTGSNCVVLGFYMYPLSAFGSDDLDSENDDFETILGLCMRESTWSGQGVRPITGSWKHINDARAADGIAMVAFRLEYQIRHSWCA